jgi:hypothetical protein
MKKLFAFFISLLAIAGVSTTIEPAFAANQDKITIEKIVEQIAPDLLADTVGPGSLRQIGSRLGTPDQSVKLNSKGLTDSNAI